MNQTKKITISIKSVISIFVILLSMYFLFLIRNVLIMLFIAFILMAAMHPLATFLTQRTKKQRLSNALAFLALCVFLIVMVMGIVPPLVKESLLAIKQLGLPREVVDTVNSFHLSLDNIQILASPLAAIPRISQLLSSTISTVIKTIIVLFLAFSLLRERYKLWRISRLFGASETTQNTIRRCIDQVETQLSTWIIGELALMFVVGLATGIGLWLLGIKYAVALGFLAGLLEILPNIGPTVAVIPAVIIAITMGSWPVVIGVVLLAVAIQQLENYLLVPQIMKHATGINPIITIPLLLIGNQIAGIGGAVLALPFILSVNIIWQELSRQ